MIMISYWTVLELALTASFVAPAWASPIKSKDPELRRNTCRHVGPKCKITAFYSETPDRWYYSAGLGCKPFSLVDCVETENSFQTLEDCESFCSGVKPCPMADYLPGCELRDMGIDEDGCNQFKYDCSHKPKP